MTASACENSLRSRHRTTNRQQTLRIPVLLSRRKSAIALKSRRQTTRNPHQFNVALAFTLQTADRVDPVEVAVGADRQQHGWMTGQAARSRWHSPIKSERPEFD